MQRVMGCVTMMVLTGCASEPAAPEVFEPPERFTIRGEATGLSEGLMVECGMDLAFEWAGASRLEVGLVYVVSGGGDVVRELTSPDGSGFSVKPFLFAEENHLRVLPGDSLEFSTPVNLETGIPFYEGIGRFSGRITGEGSAEGTWSCARFELAQDSAGTVEGVWRMEPVG